MPDQERRGRDGKISVQCLRGRSRVSAANQARSAGSYRIRPTWRRSTAGPGGPRLPQGTRPGTGRPAAPAATLAGQRTPGPTRAHLAQGGELTLVKRRNKRVGPRRTDMVLTVARRTLSASVPPCLSRSRRPAMSRAAAARFALAVLRHTQSSSYNWPVGGRSRCPWVPVGARSFWPVLARTRRAAGCTLPA